MKKVNTIDLFAGCGGLTEGFESSGLFNILACVEWEKAPYETLVERLHTKWNYKNAKDIVLRFDIQRTEELFSGWNDKLYSFSNGLDKIINNQPVDIIVGGPPCQAYSVAGRIRDVNGMRDDYRNFLFESYIKVVTHYNPKAFVFENVPGMLSASPTGTLIINNITKAFNSAGYSIISNLNNALIDFSEYGVPQKRKRIIILGINRSYYGDVTENILQKFYATFLPKHKTQKKYTVYDAIGDLPKLFPLNEEIKIGKKKYSHSFIENSPTYHISRWHNKRDQKIFSMLANDILIGENKFVSSCALKDLYTKMTGNTSNVHKYYVLRWNEPSNLIPAHLYKDGLRHIHPDPQQARSITVREAARLQTFPDDYNFIGSQADQFKMIGNAVPPTFSKKLAIAIYELLFNKE